MSNWPATKVHRSFERLWRAGVEKTIPAWYPALLRTPPSDAFVRMPRPGQRGRERQRAEEVKTRFEAKKMRIMTRGGPRPQPIVYPEDRVRRQFYRDHPYEAYRPRSMIGEEVDVEAGGSLEDMINRGLRLDGEAVVRYTMWLSKSAPMQEAYHKAIQEFVILRRQEAIQHNLALSEAAFHGTSPLASTPLLRSWKKDQLAKSRNRMNRSEGLSSSGSSANAKQSVLSPLEEKERPFRRLEATTEDDPYSLPSTNRVELEPKKDLGDDELSGQPTQVARERLKIDTGA